MLENHNLMNATLRALVLELLRCVIELLHLVLELLLRRTNAISPEKNINPKFGLHPMEQNHDGGEPIFCKKLIKLFNKTTFERTLVARRDVPFGTTDGYVTAPTHRSTT